MRNTLTECKDTQFALRPCKCRSTSVEYRRTITGGNLQHYVKCIACGNRTPHFTCRHDAQVDWNERFSI